MIRGDEQEHRSPRRQEDYRPRSLAKGTTGAKERRKSEEIKAEEKGCGVRRKGFLWAEIISLGHKYLLTVN